MASNETDSPFDVLPIRHNGPGPPWPFAWPFASRRLIRVITAEFCRPRPLVEKLGCVPSGEERVR